MFLRLLLESFRRQKRRKALAGIAVLLGTTAITAMLALATTIGDRIHQELAVYGANIVITPKAADLAINIGGVDVKPATGGAYLHEAGLAKLQTIFWHNNITGVSPELHVSGLVRNYNDNGYVGDIPVVGLWFNHQFGSQVTGAEHLHPSWKLVGSWPSGPNEAVLGEKLAGRLHLAVGNSFGATPVFPNWRNSLIEGADLHVSGIVSNSNAYDESLLVPIALAQQFIANPGAISRVEISARTRPEDAFARQNPDTLSPHQRDLWYCRPYANSIAYQIQEAIPGSDAQQVRRVEQSEGTLLSRISGLMWLVSAAALLAAGFAVSAAMATAVLERRGEIGLMRSLGAGQAAIAGLFYAESSLLAAVAGLSGYVAGSALAWALGRHIFPADGPAPLFNLVLLPVVVALAVLVAVAGSTPAIRSGLRAEVADVLRGSN